MGSVANARPEYNYSQHVLGSPRPLRIIVVGCGISGIAAVKLFKQKFSGKPVELVLYEKNADVTGTWLENRYPGCSCDIPAHSYGFSWEGNPDWTKAYVGAEELFNYFKGRALAYGVGDYVHLSHQVIGAVWNDEQGKWKVEIKNLVTNERVFDEGEVLINAAGFLNKWKWPQIDGLKSFKGHLVHSALWDTSYDFSGKDIAVIGSGSSAIQIVPQLQPVVKRLVSFNRSPTWITPEFAEEFAPGGRDSYYTKEQIAQWKADPKMFLKFRKNLESYMNHFFELQYKNSEYQENAFKQCAAAMKARLNGREDLAKKLIPEFAVGCRRLTPGHGYLEALASANATVTNSAIVLITADGIKTADGEFFKVDAIICATGFDTSHRPSFPVIGYEGKDLRDEWKDEPRSYLSVGAAGFPNYFLASGPNFPLANGALIPCLERNISFAFEAVVKMQYHGIKALSPKREAVDDFQEHKDSLMKDTVWTTGCRSWYKNGDINGKVWGPWCGSSLHYMELITHPRWEDFDITYKSQNRFEFLGNGRTYDEMHGGDLAWYLS